MLIIFKHLVESDNSNTINRSFSAHTTQTLQLVMIILFIIIQPTRLSTDNVYKKCLIINFS